MVKRGRVEEEDFEGSDDSEIDDDELDDELGLPEILANISIKEKRELLAFKKSHNDIEWEQEVLRRSDLLNRKIDMERLQRMAGATKKDVGKEKGKEKTATKGRTPAGRKKARVEEEDDEMEEEEEEEEEAQPRRRSSRAAAVASRGKRASAKLQKEEEDEDEEEEDEEEEEQESDADELDRGSDEGSDDDDLFDSDEEAEMSHRNRTGLVKVDEDEGEDELEEPVARGRLRRGATAADTKKAKPKPKSKSVSKRSGLDQYRDDDEEEEDREYSDDEDGRGRDDYDRDDRDLKEAEEEEDKSPEAELIDYLKLQLKRHHLEKWISEPFFEKAIIGTYVRVYVGDHGGQHVYKMAEVKGIEQGGRVYKLLNKKPTNIRLQLAIGAQVKKGVKLHHVSQSRITDVEFAQYKTHLLRQRGYTMLTKNGIVKRRNALLAAVRHQYTHEEINQMIKKRMGYRALVVNSDESRALKKIEKEIRLAVQEKDYEKMDELTKAHQALEDEMKAHKEQAQIMGSRQISVNQRNRMANYQKDKQAGDKKRIQGNTEASVNDPFIRRETRPKILWLTGAKLGAAQAAASKGEAAETGAEASAEKASATVSAGKGNSKCEKDDKEKDKPADEMCLRISDVSLSAVRKRVLAKYGVDPYAASKEDRRDRYLRKVCAGLPPRDSAEREHLRRGISLAVWVEKNAADLGPDGEEDGEVAQ